MLTAVQTMLSKLVSPLWRTAEVNAEDVSDTSGGIENVRSVNGSVVTRLHLGQGMIDDAVRFTSAEVLGGVPLQPGDLVNYTAVRDGPHGGWKAIRVEKYAEAWEDGGQTSLDNESKCLRPLIGTVTSFDKDGGYINENTYFPCHSLWDGYVPMKGDWVQAKYLIDPLQWTSQVQFVAPLRYSRLDQARVTSVYAKSGVVQDKVFFSLDSLLLPSNYRPSPGHLVNLVMVESSQSLYSWRALCMAPCHQSLNVSKSEVPLQNIFENKEGVVVSDYGKFGNVMIGETRALVFWIENKGSDTQTLKCLEFAGWDSEAQFFLGSDSATQRQQRPPEGSAKAAEEENNDVDKEIHPAGARREEKEVNILPGERLSIQIVCQTKSLGRCAELLLLHFSSFTMGRRLEVTVSSKEEDLLQPSSPYAPSETHPVSAAPSHVITVVAPRDPPSFSRRRLPDFLPSYSLPRALRDCVEAQMDVLVVQPCLGEALSSLNMQSRFSALLWLEELHAQKELKEFSISGALLKKGAGSLHLDVPGLAEGRPHLSIGDRVLLKKPQRNGMLMEFISYVTEICDESVSLRANSDFQHGYIGEPLDVEFSYNRLTMRRCHNALELTKDFREILFPSRVTVQTPQWTEKWLDESDENQTVSDNKAATLINGSASSISIDMKSQGTQTKDGCLPSKPIPRIGQFFNPDLNPPQREAVKRILAGECRPLPYVLFGPPGTGKTITLIETILQVYHFLPNSRVLVCTPSNSAADLICLRLHQSGFLHAASLARVNASCRQEESIPEVLRLYSKAGEDVRHASYHRIVVSTCSSAGLFHNIGVQVGHFTHVFLDEAGQATEPEALIPIAFISERDGQIVLAGDPCQLGPVIKSKIAAAFGMGVSMLERLMANPLYSRHDWGYNPRLVTKLVYNYRSHEALLVLPSKLFYRGELCVRAPRAVVDSLCQWKSLPKKGFPLIFHGVRGTEMREGINPSWFNPVEAVQVMLYCCQLAKKLYNPVAVSDIGIIAPYRKQCEKIRILLGKVGLFDIKVGSVEEFQGQEFLIIIISTVRSNESLENNDLQSTLGFLSNPKRFNVAVTRSKALLLIVGNPHILINDPCFRAQLQYCYMNGAYVGCDPPPSLRDCRMVSEE
ncbi:RNA helicase Mov10l1 isoform X1 [Takifugu flavidus]|uniref:RNA helicase n=1 Tax=Takifugu flavidus TaxID=433684 RepID=A0A5C6PCF5_9TELE|nr:RNA helicase Mov10l1 isoform X1 [Takifugu flavidus]TWW75837.1 RNA helicase [Takifugu flavidus]